jgi:hypothetical protein
MSVNSIVLQRRAKNSVSPAASAGASRFGVLPTVQNGPSPTPMVSAWRVNPRQWQRPQYAQVGYILFGAAETAVAMNVVNRVGPRVASVAGTDLVLTQAPALLFLSSGLLNLLVGTVGYRYFVELLSNSINPVKAVKLTVHMVVLFATYGSLGALYEHDHETSVISCDQLMPFIISGFLFLVLEHGAFYTSLLRVNHIRLTPLLEIGFPLAMSLSAFIVAQLDLLSLLSSKGSHAAAAPTTNVALRTGVFRADALFLVAYVSHALWLSDALTYYKLEFVVESVLLLLRTVFWVTVQQLAAT